MGANNITPILSERNAWGTHAGSVLVFAFCENKLCPKPTLRATTPLKRKFVSAKCRNQHARSVRSRDAERPSTAVAA